jgi:HEAT repeat protein
LAGTASPHPAIRIASVRALGDMQPLAEKSLQRLIEVIGDENLNVRTAAAAALTQAAATNPAAQSAVLQAMQDPSPAVRAVAVVALGDTGWSREQRREGFRRALNDADAQVRAALTAIAKTPGQMQRHAPLILEQTRAAEEPVRVAALRALAQVPKEVVHKDQFVSAADVQAAVLRGLQDSSVPVRIAATAVIAQLELYPSTILDALGENLQGPRELVVATLEVLPKFPGDTNAIVARLQPLLGHELSEVRIAAVTALAATDREPLRLTQALLPLLEDREWVVRRIAGQTLGRQGSVAVSAVPKLFELLGRHEDKDYAAESLRQIDQAPVAALRLLMDHLNSEDRRKAFYAVTLLGKLGPAAAEALPGLEALLQADSQGGTPLDDFRRNTIKEAIERIKTPATDL